MYITIEKNNMFRQDYSQQDSSISTNALKSLNSRNTKNLSLNLEQNVSNPSGISSPLFLSPDIHANTLSKLENLSQNTIPAENVKNIRPSIQKVPPLLSRRSDSVIYTLPNPSSSATTDSSENSFKEDTSKSNLGRVHSLSLSINTNTFNKNIPSRGRSHTLVTQLNTSTPTASKIKNKWVSSHNIEVLSEDNTINIDQDAIQPEVYKENVYPDGPMLVLPPYIYLYSEPLIEEVLKFDITINVAKEIPNLKPKIPKGSIKEYHHIPWTHNSRIFRDLKSITDIMNAGVQQNKKILIHCQCGVSRSASLIVAYIMRFKNMDLNESYDQLKSIAEDISPNMGLIFQLMEWGDYLKSTSLKIPIVPDKSGVKLMNNFTTVTQYPSPNECLTFSNEIIPEAPSDAFKNHVHGKPDSPEFIKNQDKSV